MRSWRAWVRNAANGEGRAGIAHEWRRRLQGEPALPEGPIRNVAVVCTGNICRSPFAAALLEHLRPDLQVRSYGLDAGEGVPADPVARRRAAEYGIDLAAHRARRLADDDARDIDLALVMEVMHSSRLARQWPALAPRIRMLGDYQVPAPHSIPDPWGREGATWDRAFQQIERAVRRLSQLVEPAQAEARQVDSPQALARPEPVGAETA